MSTLASFETAALADAIKKADKVAPGHGQAFDKAAGIVIEIDPSNKVAIVKATDLDVYSMEWVDIEDASGDSTVWRLPSKLFAQVIGSLPIGTGKSIALRQEGNVVYLATGRTRAQFYLMDASYYPTWGAFSPSEVHPVMDIGGRIGQVEWAADKSTEPYNGVHFDGEFCTATDKYRIARAPLEIPTLKEAVTVPAGILSQLLKQTGEVSIGFTPNQMLIMPDEHSQIRTILYGIAYPSLDRPLSIEYTASFKARKSNLIEIIERATAFAGGDRFPVLKCFLGKEEFAVMMRNEEVGLLGDVLELPGQMPHERTAILLTPKNILEPLQHAPSEEVTIFYNPDKPTSPVKIDGGSGYVSLVMPRRELEPGGTS